MHSFHLNKFSCALFHHFCFLNYKYEQPDPLMGCISRKRNKKFATNCWITSLSLSLSSKQLFGIKKKRRQVPASFLGVEKSLSFPFVLVWSWKEPPLCYRGQRRSSQLILLPYGNKSPKDNMWFKNSHHHLEEICS